MDDIAAKALRVMHPLFQEGEGGSPPTSPLLLHFDVISPDTACVLNRLWHSRLPKIVSSNIIRNVYSVCYGAGFKNVWYASAIWSSPVSNRLPHSWLELRRFAIAPDAPPNTASRMLGWMAKDIKLRFVKVEKLVSYQDTEVHTGGIYKAAGWTATTTTAFRTWNHAGRNRRKDQSTAPKQRWEKQIRATLQPMPISVVQSESPTLFEDYHD